MIVRQSVADVLENHVTFALEYIDRMYLNAYVPSLQTGSGFVRFLKTQLGCRVPSTARIAPQSRAFAEAFEHFAAEQGVDLVTFKRGERKDDVVLRSLAAAAADEGVLFVGKAQEEASVFRTEKRTDAQGVKYPWIIRSTVMVAPMSQRFVQALERFAEAEGVDLVTFERGERKDDVAQRYLAEFDQEEGILFIGKAQEKAHVFRTEKRRDARGTYPWIVRSTAMVNHYYVYLVDRDFGPLFIKFCSYFPYPGGCPVGC